jgi:hypothetical protein
MTVGVGQGVGVPLSLAQRSSLGEKLAVKPKENPNLNFLD